MELLLFCQELNPLVTLQDYNDYIKGSFDNKLTCIQASALQAPALMLSVAIVQSDMAPSSLQLSQVLI